MIVRFINLASCAILLCSVGAASMTDKATGITFARRVDNRELLGVGVRKKGPIKVYSVGVYCATDLKDTLSTLSRTDEKGRKALDTLCEGAKDFVEPPEGDEAQHDGKSTSFLLKMNFKVGAEKMASAIAESVAPRHVGDPLDVEELKKIIFNGVETKGVATKGTSLQFDCSAHGVDVSVDGKNQGNVPSERLAKAFCDVYLDDNCVSPTLRRNCLENCCAP